MSIEVEAAGDHDAGVPGVPVAPGMPAETAVSAGLPTRMLVLWCPDWPVVAAVAATGLPADLPAAVFSANRVVAGNALSRVGGVRRGMRRREAQSRCPELAAFDSDEARDARLFEPVAAAVEELVVGVEVVRPGLVAVPALGAAGYFGGEERLAESLLDHVSGAVGVECQIGVADGLFAATLAAHRSMLVPRGAGAEFLAPLRVTELDQPGTDRAELIDLLRRLGLRTLGAFAELPEREVISRFGRAGVLAHRLAGGHSERPPLRRRPPPELSVTEEFDPPLDRVDAAAFLARVLASRFHAGLSERGLACTRLGIHAVTENGEELLRVWRCAEPLTAQGVADRVRWQFEGWLRAGPGLRPTAGVTRLRLEPEETVHGHSLQIGLWHGRTGGRFAQLADHTAETERANRALVRVQGLLGPEGVCTALLDGGRGPGERVRLVPWGDQRTVRAPAGTSWPGRLPAPAPATVYQHPPPALVLDERGVQVRVTELHELSGPPHFVSVDGAPGRLVARWAGPWPVAVRWWDPAAGPALARVQVVLAEREPGEPETALLLSVTATDSPLWTVEGMYD